MKRSRGAIANPHWRIVFDSQGQAERLRMRVRAASLAGESFDAAVRRMIERGLDA